jgi:hypothetical protein
MPMMVVEDKDFEIEMERIGITEKKNTDNAELPIEILPTEVVIPITRGRGNKPETPAELRKVIAQMALEGEPHKEIMERFGVSQSSISAYSAGATSTARISNPVLQDKDLIESNRKVKVDINNSAAERLNMALGTITPEKLERAKLRDASSVARDMSAIMRNMRDDNGANPVNQQVIVYQPRARQEDTYEVIEVHSTH